jgi:hypothetical protein
VQCCCSAVLADRGGNRSTQRSTHALIPVVGGSAAAVTALSRTPASSSDWPGVRRAWAGFERLLVRTSGAPTAWGRQLFRRFVGQDAVLDQELPFLDP